ncbi:MAG: hypothetical protein ABI783_06650 [Actinomycetota bacterium]
MDGEKRHGWFRTFVLGSVVGASAALAAGSRRRRIQRRRGRPRGLAAFESAPCYLELIEDEREEPAVQDVRRDARSEIHGGPEDGHDTARDPHPPSSSRLTSL